MIGPDALASCCPRRLRASHKATVGIDILAPPDTLIATTNAHYTALQLAEGRKRVK